MVEKYSERLINRTKLLAKLIDELIQSKTLTINEISEHTGLSRNELNYFLGKTKKESADDYSQIKVNKLAGIIDWFQSTDFDSRKYSDKQKIQVSSIKQTFVLDKVDRVFKIFADGFQLDPNDKQKMMDQLARYHLVLRWRGKADTIQVSMLEFKNNEGSELLQWEMITPIAPKNKSDEGAKTLSLQRTDVVRGYATNHDNLITCLGRRQKSHEIYLLNIVQPDRNEVGAITNALLSTYSKDEAISRACILIKQDDQIPDIRYELRDLIGDHTYQEMALIEEFKKINVTKFMQGTSVNEEEFLNLRKQKSKLAKKIDKSRRRLDIEI
ncbi:MAG: hypothetical protein AAF429_06390 [Pseudomonadota bacterium]